MITWKLCWYSFLWFLPTSILSSLLIYLDGFLSSGSIHLRAIFENMVFILSSFSMCRFPSFDVLYCMSVVVVCCKLPIYLMCYWRSLRTNFLPAKLFLLLFYIVVLTLAERFCEMCFHHFLNSCPVCNLCCIFLVLKYWLRYPHWPFLLR